MRVKCRLRDLREARGLTLRQMEQETGISRGYLSRFERGRELPADQHVAALERAYGAPAESWFAPHVWIEIEPDELEQTLPETPVTVCGLRWEFGNGLIVCERDPGHPGPHLHSSTGAGPLWFGNDGHRVEGGSAEDYA